MNSLAFAVLAMTITGAVVRHDGLVGTWNLLVAFKSFPADSMNREALSMNEDS